MVWKFCENAQFPKLCGNCAFLQNFHIRKLDEIMVLFTVEVRIMPKRPEESVKKK